MVEAIPLTQMKVSVLSADFKASFNEYTASLRQQLPELRSVSFIIVVKKVTSETEVDAIHRNACYLQKVARFLL